MEYYDYMDTYYVSRAELSKLRRAPEEYAKMKPIMLWTKRTPHPWHVIRQPLEPKQVEELQSKRWMITFAPKLRLETYVGDFAKLYKLLVDRDAEGVCIKETNWLPWDED